VSNLAVSLAQNGARVLVVDCDLRRPTVHRNFDVASAPGLSDLIVGHASLEQALRPGVAERLDVLPCGYIPPNPAELLGSGPLRDVLKQLRQSYEWVLLDAPPILTIADTAILCPSVDGLVLVVAAERTARHAVQRAVEQVTTVGGRVVGVVLNRVDLERNSYYFGRYYGDYYRSYYQDAASRRVDRVARGADRLSRM
jgi:capsular exopolysaccharide synthesis family protein